MSVLKTGVILEARVENDSGLKSGSEFGELGGTPPSKSRRRTYWDININFHFSILEGKYHFKKKSLQLILRLLHEMICKMQHTSYGKIHSIHVF